MLCFTFGIHSDFAFGLYREMNDQYKWSMDMETNMLIAI